MPLSRTITQTGNATNYSTYLFGDQVFQSSWSNRKIPALIFAENKLPGFSVQNHGGPIGSGMPVELLFWGDWWNSPEGATRRNLIESRTQALLVSNYFSEVKQYGVERPHWRGSRTVTGPPAPGAFRTRDDFGFVPELVDALITDGVYPAPDDELIAFVVFMPKGFVESTGKNGAVGENGSHSSHAHTDFPLDRDYFYAAWVRYFGDSPGDSPNDIGEDVTRTLSHELVEMLSDPEGTSWYAGGDPEGGEIGDAAASPASGVKQTAWVNGVHVQAYWSNEHAATVVPMDLDYSARIDCVIKVESHHATAGTFRVDPRDSRLCSILPACCFADKLYHYTMTQRNEAATLSVETQRYRQPQFAWTVGGQPVNGDETVLLDVIAGVYDGRVAKWIPKSVSLQCQLAGAQLVLRAVDTLANFDVDVSCSVTDGSIVGKIRTNVVSTPTLTLGFVGVDLADDAEYQNQRSACEKAASKMFNGVPKTTGKVRVGAPVEFNPEVLAHLPAYARVTQYQQARVAVELSQKAYAALPEATAKALTAALVFEVPALQAAIASSARQHTHSMASVGPVVRGPVLPRDR
jgi:hypothetical protein